jgi:hypothetical protein
MPGFALRWRFQTNIKYFISPLWKSTGESQLWKSTIFHMAQQELGGGIPLHYAAARGQMDSLRLLLEARADKDARDSGPQGWTPLLLAAQNGQVDAKKNKPGSGWIPQI